MTRPRQKQEERIHAEWFCANAGFDLLPDDREKPDFLIRKNGSVLGLEVTQMFKDCTASGGSKMREKEARRSNLLDRVATRYYALDRSIPIRVNALFDDLHESEVDEIVATLRNVAMTLNVWEDRRVSLRRVSLRDSQAILYIRRLPDECSEYRRWNCPTNTIGGEREIKYVADPIRKRIAEKARKAAGWDVGLHNTILLIVADYNYNSGRFNIDQPLECDPCGFAAIYFGTFPDKVEALYTAEFDPN